MTETEWQRWYRLDPDPRFSPQVGVLVAMMAYARMTTLEAVQGLGTAELDAVTPASRNSIGTLLAHIAAVDRAYQLLSFGGRDLDPVGDAGVLGGLTMGEEGPAPMGGRDLDSYLAELAEARAATLDELAGRDDAWLASRLTVPGFDFPTHHWAWFHVMEDEVSHRGQIRLIRRALGAGSP